MSHGRALFEGTLVGGEWRIERVLGQGGFGVTYEARHRTTGAHAALKEYMPSGLCTRAVDSGRITAAQGPAADIFKRGLAGFIKEAETLARLDHPSIVRVGCAVGAPLPNEAFMRDGLLITNLLLWIGVLRIYKSRNIVKFIYIETGIRF